ncbi:MAG: Flp pilus assembly complex ATPase component TadA, partial [Helicobacter sp.]|nr:Flp pilus assembly complex ATPase component TadA [Helicobacter sp.]
NRERQKIITIEDPIEYEMQGITQVVLNDKIHFGFSEVLRNILRQDPDILMIGEVRDQETLQLAFQASLTGHLVLCTLHTNDALESITRLLDMGIEPYFLASALLLVVSQRLVPKLCPHCRESYRIDYADSNMAFYRSKGCVRCYGRGFLGRELLYEILPITKNLKEALHQKATQKELLEIAKDSGFVRMVEQGLEKAKSGLMTLEILHGIQNDF